MSTSIVRRFLAGIGAVALAACKTPPSATSALRETTPDPSPSFSEFCGKANPSQNDVFLLKLLTTNLFPGQNPSSVLASKTCDQIHARLGETKKLKIFGSVTDLGPLATLGDLEDMALDLSITSWPKNFKAIKALNLIKISITPNDPGYAGIDDAQAAEIVATVASFPELTEIYLSGLALGDLSPLAPLTKVKTLGVSKTGIESLAFVASWDGLVSLSAHQNRIKDLSPLSNLLSLRSLDLEQNKIESLDAIIPLTNIEFLVLSANPQFPEVLALQYMGNLQYLWLAGAGITDLSPLKSLPLVRLDLSDSPVTTLAPLAGMPKLRELDVRNSKITDVDVITTLKELGVLRIDGTKVAKLPKLVADHPLGVANLQGTLITNLCPFLRAPQLVNLMTPQGAIMNKQKIEIARQSCPP